MFAVQSAPLAVHSATFKSSPVHQGGGVHVVLVSGLIVGGVVTLAGLASYQVCAAAYRSFGPYIVPPLFAKVRYWCSAYLHRFAKRPPAGNESSVLRAKFAEQPLLAGRPNSSVPHPVAANSRLASVRFMEQMATTLGLEAYYYQMSVADQRNSRAGSRSYYFAKDAEIEPRPYAPAPVNSLLCIVDVDYYMDMNYIMVQEFKPILLYTFVPEVPARSNGHTSYCFQADGSVTSLIAGGATYNHQLWNYGTDCLIAMVHDQLAIYKVERRTVSVDRQLVLLTPVARWRWFNAFIAWCVFGTPENVITRFNPVQGEFVRMSVQREEGLEVSTGQVATFSCATTSAQVDAQLSLAAKNGSTPITVATVMAIAQLADGESQQVLVAYHRKRGSDKPPVVYAPESSVRTYQPIDTPYYEETKPIIKAFMGMIVAPAFGHLSGKSMDKEIIKRRVTDVAAASVSTMHPMTHRHALEFFTKLVPVPGVLTMESIDLVYEKQNRPAQRQILSAVEMVGDDPTRRVKSFDKHEACDGPNDGRNISTIGGYDKASYSMVCYAIAALLKDAPWYAFGKTPVDVAERVTAICSRATTFLETDCSRMDGRVSQVVRLLEREFLERAFAPGQAREFALKCHWTQYNLQGITKHGVRYDTLWSRLSGSPETSLFNTILNATMAFVTLRVSGLSVDAAYAALGIYGGDDGGTADVSPVLYSRIASEFDQVLTPDCKQRGQNVKFLARYYGPGVWYGDSNSCCDIRRQLVKFHATPVMDPRVKPWEKLVQKCQSFLLTDAQTPVLGRICKIVDRLSKMNHNGLPSTTHRELVRYTDCHPESVQYPNRYEDWMKDLLMEQIPTFRYDEFEAWSETDFLTYDQVLAIPCFADPVATQGQGKPGYVVDPHGDAPTTSVTRAAVAAKPAPTNRKAKRAAKRNAAP